MNSCPTRRTRWKTVRFMQSKGESVRDADLTSGKSGITLDRGEQDPVRGRTGVGMTERK